VPKIRAGIYTEIPTGANSEKEVENVENNVMLLWQRLYAKYGNVRKYVDLVLADLSKGSKGDGSATLLMINNVEKSYRDLARIGAEWEMSNAYMIALIETGKCRKVHWRNRKVQRVVAQRR